MKDLRKQKSRDNFDIYKLEKGSGRWSEEKVASVWINYQGSFCLFHDLGVLSYLVFSCLRQENALIMKPGFTRIKLNFVVVFLFVASPLCKTDQVDIYHFGPVHTELLAIAMQKWVKYLLNPHS